MSQRAESAGSIYDLGYRHYDGPRLGRRHAILSLYLYSLRAAFGLGRRTTSKIFPVVLVVIAFIPAVIQLGIASIASGAIDIFHPYDYFGFVELPVALFCAAIAPEMGGRDQRTHTLSLYFSRALRRTDYAYAKLAAFTTALLVLTLVPQGVLFFGNALSGNDAGGYLKDNWKDIPRIVAAGVALAAMMAAVSLAIAAQTPRKAYSTVAVVAFFVVTFPIVAILVNGIGGGGDWTVVLSPFDFLFGTSLWLFNIDPNPDSTLGNAELAMWVYPVTTLVYTVVCGFLVVRRFEQVAA
jgi:ABC-2 type transport system permease protein